MSKLLFSGNRPGTAVPGSSGGTGAAPPAVRSRFLRRWRAAGLGVFLLGAACAWLLWGRPYHGFGEIFPQPRPAYDFNLTDQDGQPFRFDRLRGQVVLLTFGFTHCPNVCPTTLVHLAQVVQSLSPEARARLKVLFVTVDPQRDTPDQLKQYLPFFDPNFLGATGTPEEIARTAKAYGVFYEADLPAGQSSGQTNYNVNHSADAYLVDGEGRACAVYRHDQLSDHEHLAKDLEHFTGMIR